MKKVITVLLILVLVLSFAPAALAADVVASGSCGDNITWELDNDGTLRISGSGPMYDFEWYEGGPWNGQSVEAKKAILSDEITSIGNYAFNTPWTNTPSLKEVNIPASCVRVGDYSFACCDNLTRISIPIKVSIIGIGAFDSCDSLKDAYYEGTRKQWEEVSIGEANEWLTMKATIHFADGDVILPDVISDWAKEEMKLAVSHGLLPKEYRKNYQKPISRLVFSKLAVILLEKINSKTIDTILVDKGLSTNPVFTDTDDISVLSANALGIINGMGDGMFNPNGTLTRAQCAAILNRIANVQGIATAGYTQSFSDTVNHWVAPELGWPVANGIIKGVGQNKFDPNGQLTTEQAVVMIYRTYITVCGLPF